MCGIRVVQMPVFQLAPGRSSVLREGYQILLVQESIPVVVQGVKGGFQIVQHLGIDFLEGHQHERQELLHIDTPVLVGIHPSQIAQGDTPLEKGGFFGPGLALDVDGGNPPQDFTKDGDGEGQKEDAVEFVDLTVRNKVPKAGRGGGHDAEVENGHGGPSFPPAQNKGQKSHKQNFGQFGPQDIPNVLQEGPEVGRHGVLDRFLRGYTGGLDSGVVWMPIVVGTPGVSSSSSCSS